MRPLQPGGRFPLRRQGIRHLQKLIVHIGAGKVASTTIQAFLWENAGRLQQQGIIVLDRYLRPAGRQAKNSMGADGELEKIMAGPGGDAEKVTRIADRYMAAVDMVAGSSGRRAIVISAENLMRCLDSRSNVIAAFKIVAAHVDLQVLLYVRRPDLWLESAWKQWALKYEAASSARWALKMAGLGIPNFLAEARAWKSILEPERLVVRIVDPAALWGNAVLDDLALLLEAENLERNIPPENPILHPAFLRFCHRHRDLLFDDIHDHRAFVWGAERGLATGSGKRMLKPSVRHRVLAIMADANRDFLAEFCPTEAPGLLPEWCPDPSKMPIREEDLDEPRPAPVLEPFERYFASWLGRRLRGRTKE